MSIVTLFNYIDVFVYCWLFLSIISVKKTRTSHILIIFTVQASFMTMVNLFFDDAILNTIVSFITLGICFYYLSRHLLFSIEFTSYVVMLAMLSEEVIYYFIAIVFKKPISDLSFGYLFVAFLTIKILFILSLYLFLKLNSNIFIMKPPYKYWIINIAFPIVNTIMIHFLAFFFPFSQQLPNLAVFAIIIVTIYAYLLIVNNAIISKFYSDASLMQKQIDLYKRHIEIWDERQRQIRVMKHDLKSTILMISALLEHDDIDGAKLKLQQQLHRTTDVTYHLKTGITAIDSILNCRAEDAAAFDIKLTLENDVRENVTIDPFEVGYVLGNLIDNAIEAVKEMDDLNKRIIKITFQITGNMIYIVVINPCHNTPEPNYNKPFFKSRKKDSENHGLGLTIINSIAKSHHGRFTLDYDDSKVTAAVYMYQDK